MNENQHWVYIALAYGATFAIIGYMAWRILSDHRRLSRELARFEDTGEEQ